MSTKDWICDERRMKLAKESAVYMHCLPADRGSDNRRRDRRPAVHRLQGSREPPAAKAIMSCTMREQRRFKPEF
ncbi:MAG: hypothetical protein R3C45_13185 [Phycisphaerales bacterium]